MYTRQEAGFLKQSFWAAFGRYMAPIPGAAGHKVNWINYKTGVKYIYFRMDVTRNNAVIGIELTHPDKSSRLAELEKFRQLKHFLNDHLGETWNWQQEVINENGQEISTINKITAGVNVFSKDDWPGIISFLKPRMIGLDAFWADFRVMFE